MPWQPQEAVQDLRPITANLLAFMQTHQADALAWATTAPAAPPAPFRKFYSSAAGRLQTLFPSLMILDQTAETDLTSDQIITDLTLTLEGTVTGPDADKLVETTKIYDLAVCSMLANIPDAELTAGASGFTHSMLYSIASGHDIIRQNSSAFLQVFQVRAVYRLFTSAYETA